ncbi:MAG: GLUG motif-containing protein, partial [Rhizomicrobium sp.]
STAKGSVSGWEAGGLVGGNIGAIDQSYSTGAVTGTFAGGLVGVNADDPDVGTITNSYSTGNAGLGGFIDYYEGGDIESSYSTGSVTTGGGGFACGIDGPVSSDYWDTTTSGTDYGGCSDENVSGITGLTTQQLQSGLPEGFDPTMWAENPKINNGLPYLIGNPPNK